MKKFLLIVVFLVLAVVAGLMIYVSSIDWNEHKDKIARQFSEVTGKEIVFQGPVSFKILPSPYLTATQVKIFNPGEKELPLVEVRKLVANLALAPLLKGNLDIKRMVLEYPEINFEVNDEGRINWQYDLSPEQMDKIEKSQVTLNSVSLEGATVNIDYPSNDINLQLNNLNGEVIADSILGPYRIEGNYIKDNHPEGFAISLGRFSDSFATSLNLVITHPNSNSYFRFDGSFMLANKVLNGNMIIESSKLQDFVKANFKKFELEKAYDYPLALTCDINANENQVNLNNMVIKYGETQGAGSMQIPLNDGLSNDENAVKPRIEMAFNFTDFNLDPVVYTVKEFVAKYQNKENVYIPDSSFDMLVDLKSLRTQYNGQPVKNFEASFDVVNNIIAVNNLTAVLPGDTDIKVKGDLSELDGEPFYNLDVSFNSNDFLKTLNWVNINPTVSVASTYRKAVGSAKLSGTFDKIHISPFNLTVDKSSLSGEAGIRLGQRADIMLVLNADMINFDNYITPLPKEEKEKNWAQRMQYRFARLGFLNDFDMQITAKLDLGIYENLPFEKVDFKADLLEGKMEIERLAINSVANAQMEYAGMLTGFGKVPTYENLKYAVKTGDVSALINKFEFKAPNLDYKQLKNFESKGIATGDLEKFAIKSISKLENLDVNFGGQVTKKNDEFDLNGDLEVKHPDFVKMLNTLNIQYNPQAYSLGLFNLKTKFTGTLKQFKANPLNINIGFNDFYGDLTFDQVNGRPNLLTTLTVNKLEIERFLNGSSSVENKVIAPQSTGEAEFLSRPFWSKNKIAYNFLEGFDLNGNLKISDLSYKSYTVKEAEAVVSLVNGTATVSGFKGKYRGGEIEWESTLDIRQEKAVNGHLKLQNTDVSLLNLNGSKYGLLNGTFSGTFIYNSTADSAFDFVNNLNGSLNYTINNTVFKGWNLQKIYEDISKREVPDGLLALVKEQLQQGNTSFSEIKGKLNFNKEGFSLSDTSLRGTGVSIEAFGDGSLSEWVMNTVFNVKYDEPKYLPGYSFSLKGTLDNPLLDVNVSALFDLYQSKQDKIAANQKAQAEAELNRLQGYLNEQKKATEALLADAKDSLNADLKRKQEIAENPEAARQYKLIAQDLDNETAIIAQALNAANSEQPSDELIRRTATANERSTARLERIRTAVNKAYLDDLKYKMNRIYNLLIDDYNQSKMVLFNFNSARDNLASRLSKIETTFSLGNDASLNSWKQFIDDKASLLDNQNKELLDRLNSLRQSNDAADIAAYNEELVTLQEDVAKDVNSMKKSIEEYIKYGNEQVSAAEEAYSIKLRDEEVKRKLEENTGRISIKKTGKSFTVQRDIEEIEKSEKLTHTEKVKVLDFSKDHPKKAVGKAQNKDNTNVIKRGRVNSN